MIIVSQTKHSFEEIIEVTQLSQNSSDRHPSAPIRKFTHDRFYPRPDVFVFFRAEVTMLHHQGTNMLPLALQRWMDGWMMMIDR